MGPVVGPPPQPNGLTLDKLVAHCIAKLSGYTITSIFLVIVTLDIGYLVKWPDAHTSTTLLYWCFRE